MGQESSFRLGLLYLLILSAHDRGSGDFLAPGDACQDASVAYECGEAGGGSKTQNFYIHVARYTYLNCQPNPRSKTGLGTLLRFSISANLRQNTNNT